MESSNLALVGDTNVASCAEAVDLTWSDASTVLDSSPGLETGPFPTRLDRFEDHFTGGCWTPGDHLRQFADIAPYSPTDVLFGLPGGHGFSPANAGDRLYNPSSPMYGVGSPAVAPDVPLDLSRDRCDTAFDQIFTPECMRSLDYAMVEHRFREVLQTAIWVRYSSRLPMLVKVLNRQCGVPDVVVTVVYADLTTLHDPRMVTVCQFLVGLCADLDISINFCNHF